MKDRKFILILIAITVIGLMATAAHAIYIAYAFERSSIIQLIAREVWW